MKTFLSTVKGKIIAGVITLAVIAAAVVTIVLLNTGYRTISVEDLTGVTTISMGKSHSEAFKRQNLKSGSYVFVEEASDLTLALDTNKHVYAGEFTSFSLEAVGKPGNDSRTVIKLDEGSVLSEIDEKLSADESYVVESPNATMAVRGTTFTVTVNFDEEGLCHTLVEVEKGTVEVTEKDENGNPTDEVQTLEAGGKTEVISLVINRNEDNETPSGGNGSHSDDDLPPEYIEPVYQDPEALAVEAALETFLNGGELDTANFDRVTDLKIYGRVAFVTLDDQFGGKGQHLGGSFTGEQAELTNVSYDPGSGETIEIPTSNNTLTDLNFLAGMNNLRSLMVESGKVNDITFVANLPNLHTLYLSFNEISDISPLENLTNLYVLYLENNQISDISPIKKLKNLMILSLPSNNISDISPISGLNNLDYLILSGNNFSDLSPISGLTNLTCLGINNANVSDLSPISGLSKLEELSLGHNNNISDLSPISGLTNLTRLEMDNTNISDIFLIANFKKLNFISIYDCPINDYSPLYGLTGLQNILCWGIDDDELAKLQQALPGTSIDG